MLAHLHDGLQTAGARTEMPDRITEVEIMMTTPVDGRGHLRVEGGKAIEIAIAKGIGHLGMAAVEAIVGVAVLGQADPVSGKRARKS